MSDDQNPQGDKLDLDLIRMVQNARMAHDDDAAPSQVPGVYWIETKRNPDSDAPVATPRSGEWRIHTTVDDVDAIWNVIKEATQAGKLGYKAKVSTAPAHNQGHPHERIICVRTYDADDTADVARVKEQLESLGMNPKAMEYQTDRAQLAQEQAFKDRPSRQPKPRDTDTGEDDN